MSESMVHYKFGHSLKKYDTLTFDSQVLTLPELKRMIVVQKKLGRNVSDVDLVVTDQDGREFTEDDYIPRNQLLIVKRVPASKMLSRNLRLPPSNIGQDLTAAPTKEDSADSQAKPQAPVNIPKHLLCQECKYPYRDAVKTPCCNCTFCNECIRQAVLVSDEFLCPVCTQPCPPAELKANTLFQRMVNDFLKEHPERAHPSLRPTVEEPPAETNEVKPESTDKSNSVIRSDKSSEVKRGNSLPLASRSRSVERLKEKHQSPKQESHLPRPPQAHGRVRQNFHGRGSRNGPSQPTYPMVLPQQAIMMPQQTFPMQLRQIPVINGAAHRFAAYSTPFMPGRRYHEHSSRRVDHRGYSDRYGRSSRRKEHKFSRSESYERRPDSKRKSVKSPRKTHSKRHRNPSRKRKSTSHRTPSPSSQRRKQDGTVKPSKSPSSSPLPSANRKRAVSPPSIGQPLLSDGSSPRSCSAPSERAKSKPNESRKRKRSKERDDHKAIKEERKSRRKHTKSKSKKSKSKRKPESKADRKSKSRKSRSHSAKASVARSQSPDRSHKRISAERSPNCSSNISSRRSSEKSVERPPKRSRERSPERSPSQRHSLERSSERLPNKSSKLSVELSPQNASKRSRERSSGGSQSRNQSPGSSPKRSKSPESSHLHRSPTNSPGRSHNSPKQSPERSHNSPKQSPESSPTRHKSPIRSSPEKTPRLSTEMSPKRYPSPIIIDNKFDEAPPVNHGAAKLEERDTSKTSDKPSSPVVSKSLATPNEIENSEIVHEEEPDSTVISLDFPELNGIRQSENEDSKFNILSPTSSEIKVSAEPVTTLKESIESEMSKKLKITDSKEFVAPHKNHESRRSKSVSRDGKRKSKKSLKVSTRRSRRSFHSHKVSRHTKRPDKLEPHISGSQSSGFERFHPRSPLYEDEPASTETNGVATPSSSSWSLQSPPAQRVVTLKRRAQKPVVSVRRVVPDVAVESIDNLRFRPADSDEEEEEEQITIVATRAKLHGHKRSSRTSKSKRQRKSTHHSSSKTKRRQSSKKVSKKKRKSKKYSKSEKKH
eukprot:805910_1